MIHLWDRLVAEGFRDINRNDHQMYGGGTWLGPLIGVPTGPPIEKFLIDEASTFYFQGGRDEWEPKDFLVTRPPFDTCWFESRAPEYVQVAGRRIPWEEFTGQSGVVAYGGLMHVIPADYVGTLKQQGRVPPALQVATDARWHVTTSLFVRLKSGGLTGNVILGAFSHSTDEIGVMLPLATGNHWQWATPPIDDPAQQQNLWRQLGDVGQSLLDPILLSLSFMACVNITTQPASPPEKLAKAFARRHRGQRLVTFHELVIAPTDRRAHPYTGQAHGGTGPGKRLHTVRGHFRHMPEVGASGRRYRKRLFWVRPHARGDKEYGEVSKTYIVTPGDYQHE